MNRAGGEVTRYARSGKWQMHSRSKSLANVSTAPTSSTHKADYDGSQNQRNERARSGGVTVFSSGCPDVVVLESSRYTVVAIPSADIPNSPAIATHKEDYSDSQNHRNDPVRSGGVAVISTARHGVVILKSSGRRKDHINRAGDDGTRHARSGKRQTCNIWRRRGNQQRLPRCCCP